MGKSKGASRGGSSRGGGKLKEAFSSGGQVHPIRSSPGYSPKKAGEKKGKRK